MSSKKKSPKKARGKEKRKVQKKIKKKTGKKKTGGSSSKKFSLVLQPSEGSLQVEIPGRITPVQLELFDNLGYEEWRQTLHKVAQIRNGGSWWVGDVLNHGERHYGETYVQAASETGLSEDTLTILKHVALRVAPENRIKELSWSHHREIAKFPPDEQAGWLGIAVKKGWNVRELQEALRKKGRRKASKENGDGESDATGKSCECCGKDGAPMKVCGACGSVAVKAIETVGVDGAIELLKRKPSNPQKEMLQWALDHIKEPTSFDTDQEDTDWHARYEALLRTTKRKEGKSKERVAA